MMVIRHQCVRGDDPTVPLDDVREEIEESTPVTVVAENIAPLVAAAGEVPECSGIFETQGSSHAGRGEEDGEPARPGCGRK
jgi:hypothetical protein